jgi:hypothetical protein
MKNDAKMMNFSMMNFGEKIWRENHDGMYHMQGYGKKSTVSLLSLLQGHFG